MILTVESAAAQVVWQEESESEAPEQAILVTAYGGSKLIELKQCENEVVVNYESVPDLIKALKAAKEV